MDKRRNPRALTLTLPNAKQPFLVLEGQKYTLRNFSQEGLGIWVTPPAPAGLSSGRRLKGDVHIGEHHFPVELEVAHRSSRLIGVKLIHRSQELNDIFRELLEPTLYATGLVPFRNSGGEDLDTGYPRLWYVGDGATELVVWYNDLRKAIMAIQICWIGSWVFRTQFESPKTGYLANDFPARSGRKVTKDELMIQHEVPDPDLLSQGAQFLTSVPPPLPGHLLWQFLETGEQVYLPDEIFQSGKVA